MSIDPRILLTYRKKFGENLKNIRALKSVTQNELAARCNIEKTAISRIENGRTNITLNTAVTIALSLEIDLKELFDFSTY